MTKKDAFKSFVRKNPNLIKYVRTGEMDWQKFYELYDLYGEDETAWSLYLKKEKTESQASINQETNKTA